MKELVCRPASMDIGQSQSESKYSGTFTVLLGKAEISNPNPTRFRDVRVIQLPLCKQHRCCNCSRMPTTSVQVAEYGHRYVGVYSETDVLSFFWRDSSATYAQPRARGPLAQRWAGKQSRVQHSRGLTK